MQRSFRMSETLYGTVIHRLPVRWGLCLGRHIIVGYNASYRTLRHEYGHYLQYKKLGPLYWFIIGIPSLLHAVVWTVCGKRWNYYRFFTEAWADRLSAEYFKEASV